MHDVLTASPPITVSATLRAAVARLATHDAQHEAQTAAEVLLAHALRRARSWLYAHGDREMEPAQSQAFESLLRRREAGEPVAYLTGYRGFWAFDLMVTPDTLIPRPDTERLVELALERAPPTPGVRIADLGTGSGAIALALAYERRQAQIVATDVSPGALKVAAANARALGLRNVQLREGSWWVPLKQERFDVIVSNPPYIAESDPHLHRGDLRYEPAKALASGRDGLDAISLLINGAGTHLHPGGWLLLEHGWGQGEAVRALMNRVGFKNVQSACDLEGRERVTLGRS